MKKTFKEIKEEMGLNNALKIINPIRAMLRNGETNQAINITTLVKNGYEIDEEILDKERLEILERRLDHRLAYRSQCIREGYNNEDVRDYVNRQFRNKGLMVLEPIDLTDDTLNEIRESISKENKILERYENVCNKINDLKNNISNIKMGISMGKRCKYCYNVIDKDYLKETMQLKRKKEKLLNEIRTKLASVHSIDIKILNEIKNILDLSETPDEKEGRKEIIYELLKKNPMTTKKISDTLGISINAVNSYICRLRDKIESIEKKGRFKIYTAKV